MNLIELVNNITKNHAGTFIICDKHLEEFKEMHPEEIFNYRYLTKGFEGECQMCAEGELSPIQFESIPESIEIMVTFDNGISEMGWHGCGQIGHIQFIQDNDGRIYNTQEALHRRGVRKLNITGHFEMHLDHLDP